MYGLVLLGVCIVGVWVSKLKMLVLINIQG